MDEDYGYSINVEGNTILIENAMNNSKDILKSYANKISKMEETEDE